MKIFMTAITFILFFFEGISLSAAEEIEPVYGNFVLFSQPQNSVQLEAVTMEARRIILDTCDELGRLLHVEANRLNYTVESIADETGEADYESIAQLLGVSVYMVISIYGSGKEIAGELRCVAIDADYKPMERTVRVRGMVPANIPVKLARETAELHRDFPVKAKLHVLPDSGEYLVDAGQWHRLGGNKFSTDAGELKLIDSGRYRSRGSLNAKISNGAVLTIKQYPNVDKTIKSLDERLERNTIYRYGIGHQALKGDDPEARFIVGTCIINTGANACLPGYGAFLSTGYLGFTQAEPHIPGLSLSIASIAAHFTLTEFMTGFSTNFFPWIQDSDKSNAMLRLQRFLWLTLPITFTLSYFDQLAWQMKKSQNLPPFFMYKDCTAAVLSLLFPGGGLMYKGHLLAGWGYYYTEMALTGFAFYNLDNKNGKYAFAALGAVKLLELVHAFIASPAYSFYELEKESGKVSASLNMEIFEKENILKFGLAVNF